MSDLLQIFCLTFSKNWKKYFFSLVYYKIFMMCAFYYFLIVFVLKIRFNFLVECVSLVICHSHLFLITNQQLPPPSQFHPCPINSNLPPNMRLCHLYQKVMSKSSLSALLWINQWPLWSIFMLRHKFHSRCGGGGRVLKMNNPNFNVVVTVCSM